MVLPSDKFIMLTIRDEQMAAFRRHRLVQFKQLLVRDLEAALEHAGISWDHAETERQVELGASSAESAGFSRECDIARFTILLSIHLGAFGKEPLPKAVFDIGRAFGARPEVRLQRLESWLLHWKERQSHGR